STECSLEVFCSINEKHGIIEIMFLGKFLQESFRQHGRSRRVQPSMGDFVRLWINGSVQPISMFVKLNHRLIERDVIRIFVTSWL
ncbi:hypothetical protein C486_17587, partial [Natrinema gari JCM 14663]